MQFAASSMVTIEIDLEAVQKSVEVQEAVAIAEKKEQDHGDGYPNEYPITATD